MERTFGSQHQSSVDPTNVQEGPCKAKASSRIWRDSVSPPCWWDPWLFRRRRSAAPAEALRSRPKAVPGAPSRRRAQRTASRTRTRTPRSRRSRWSHRARTATAEAAEASSQEALEVLHNFKTDGGRIRPPSIRFCLRQCGNFSFRVLVYRCSVSVCQ